MRVLAHPVRSYNHSRHRSIGMRPSDVNLKNESVVWERLYGDEVNKLFKYKFRVEDHVRISKARRMFKKGYLPSWTEEVFTITKRIRGNPPVYKIADYHGDELEGTFYEPELQEVIKTDSDYYRVERVIKSRMRNKQMEHFVKWLVYPDSFNSWIPASNVKSISK